MTRFRGPTRIVASLLANKALFGSLLRDNALQHATSEFAQGDRLARGRPRGCIKLCSQQRELFYISSH